MVRPMTFFMCVGSSIGIRGGLGSVSFDMCTASIPFTLEKARNVVCAARGKIHYVMSQLAKLQLSKITHQAYSMLGD